MDSTGIKPPLIHLVLLPLIDVPGVCITDETIYNKTKRIYRCGSVSGGEANIFGGHKIFFVLTMSGVELLPSVVWLVLSAVDRLALLLLSPTPSSLLPPSRSSITKSIGILPFKHEMYR